MGKKTLFSLGTTLLLVLIGLTPVVWAGAENGEPLRSETGVLSPRTPDQKPWALSLGLRASYFHMTRNKGEIFRNITLLSEEQDVNPYKPTVILCLPPYLGLELSYDRFKAATLNRAFDIYPEHDRRWTDGWVEWSPLMLGLQLRYPLRHPTFEPYLAGGLSFNQTRWKRNDWYYYGFPSLEAYQQWTSQGLAPEEYPNAGYRRIFATDDHCLGTWLGLGADIHLSPHWGVNLEARYHWAKVNFTYTLAYDGGDTVISRDRGTFILDAWIWTLGMKFSF